MKYSKSRPFFAEFGFLEEITLTLYVLETPDAFNTVTNAYVMHTEINLSRVWKRLKKRTENATSLFDIVTDGRMANTKM